MTDPDYEAAAELEGIQPGLGSVIASTMARLGRPLSGMALRAPGTPITTMAAKDGKGLHRPPRSKCSLRVVGVGV